MDRPELLSLLLLGLYPALLCAAIGTDLARRVIPNLVVAGLLAGFAMVAGLTPLADLPARLLVAAAVTAAGFALFAQDVIGAGDAKLAGALVLWLDPIQVPVFLLACSLIGAALTCAATLTARARRRPASACRSLVKHPRVSRRPASRPLVRRFRVLHLLALRPLPLRPLAWRLLSVRPLALVARTGETLPYGVALAGAGLLLFPSSSLMLGL